MIYCTGVGRLGACGVVKEYQGHVHRRAGSRRTCGQVQTHVSLHSHAEWSWQAFMHAHIYLTLTSMTWVLSAFLLALHVPEPGVAVKEYMFNERQVSPEASPHFWNLTFLLEMILSYLIFMVWRGFRCFRAGILQNCKTVALLVFNHNSRHQC